LTWKLLSSKELLAMIVGVAEMVEAMSIDFDEGDQNV
jgi:hypothetical protein